ncbi:MAG: hypothetical protein KY476_00995 [Planctomycetes bacterium]|nr:hypothetical protein [Planctomycetota bacterium]
MIPAFTSLDDFRRWRSQRERERARFDELLPAIVNKDGLVPTSEIVLTPNGNWYLKRDKAIPVVPHWRVEPIAALLQARPDLWPLASLRVRPESSLVGRAPVFGVPFARAVEHAMQNNLSEARYWGPPSLNQWNAIHSELWVRIDRLKESEGPSLGLKAWEWVGEGVEINYAHMILTQDGGSARHLDGANIEYSAEADVREIFARREKRKGVAYSKYFRLDGDIAVGDAIEIVRHFFLVKELVCEYFDCIPSWPET